MKSLIEVKKDLTSVIFSNLTDENLEDLFTSLEDVHHQNQISVVKSKPYLNASKEDLNKFLAVYNHEKSIRFTGPQVMSMGDSDAVYAVIEPMMEEVEALLKADGYGVSGDNTGKEALHFVSYEMLTGERTEMSDELAKVFAKLESMVVNAMIERCVGVASPYARHVA